MTAPPRPPLALPPHASVWAVRSTFVTPGSPVLPSPIGRTLQPATCGISKISTLRSLTRSTDKPYQPTGGLRERHLRRRSLTHPAQPPADPLHRFAHVGGGAGVAEADEIRPAHGIEIDAGRGGDARLFQHALGKIEAVVREARHVGVEVEGAVDGKEFIEPRARKARDENAAVLLVAVLDRLHLLAPVEGGER